MSEITHYWSIVNLSNPPGVYWLMSDGSCVYGYANQGELPKETRPATKPFVIRGVNPLNTSEPMNFGEWVPVANWFR
jgi:hypothetical protein